jgi:hypothetical protein
MSKGKWTNHKKELLHFSQHIESIFTREELDSLVIDGKLEKVIINKTCHYVKSGSKKFFEEYMGVKDEN